MVCVAVGSMGAPAKLEVWDMLEGRQMSLFEDAHEDMVDSMLLLG